MKSATQAISGDLEGAKKTQKNLLRKCSIVSQATSAVQAARGNVEGARKTKLEFVQVLDGVANEIVKFFDKLLFEYDFYFFVTL